MKLVLLGAGASRGTFDDAVVPTASEFGRTLGDLDPCWKQTFPALLKVVEHLDLDLGDWRLEPVWSCIDYYAKLQPALPLPKPWHAESRQLKKALLAVYGRRCDDLRAATDCTLASLLGTLGVGDVLVSLNYDTIAERIARDVGRRLVLAPGGVNGGVRLAKPHGSTNWTLDLKSRGVTGTRTEGAEVPSSLSPEEVDCGREPLLLGAVPIKSELISEVQHYWKVPEVFDTISVQWRTVVEAVRDAETLVVCGYGFPPEDQYGRFLIQEGLRLRGRSSPLRIEVFELRTREPDVAKELVSVFQGRFMELVFLGPILPRGAA